MIASVVLKSIFALFFLAIFFLILINIDYLRLMYAYILAIIEPEMEITVADVNQTFIYIFIGIPLLFIILVSILAYNIFWALKSKQRFYASYKQIAIFQFINSMTLVITPISAILMIIAAFCEDDGKPIKLRKQNRHKIEKYKKKKIKLPHQAKAEIKVLKFKRRKGIISQELYDKQVARIIKKYGTN